MTDSLRIRLLAITLVLISSPLHAEGGLDTSRSDVDSFVRMMENDHGMQAAETRKILAAAEIQPPIIEAMQRPAEKVKPWYEYRAIFLTDERIKEGVDFWKAHQQMLESVSSRTGVPPEIIVGILGVETFYGKITGRYRVIDALATLAFEYPPRSRFFTGELEQFLLLSREQEIDPLAATGSYAGAMGGPQFISSSYRAYAVDGSGDGRVDLWTDWADIMASVANYFDAHGWQQGGKIVTEIGGPVPDELLSDGLVLDRSATQVRPYGVEAEDGENVMVFALETETGPRFWVGYKNFFVITRYNRNNMYAMAVHELGRAVRAQVEADGHTG